MKKKMKPHAVKLMNARAAGLASTTAGRSRVFKSKRDKLKRLSWKKVEEQLE